MPSKTLKKLRPTIGGGRVSGALKASQAADAFRHRIAQEGIARIHDRAARNDQIRKQVRETVSRTVGVRDNPFQRVPLVRRKRGR